MERSGAPTELEKPGEVRGVKPEDLMRFQPANTHRGLRSCEPRKEAGHMTASNPPASAQSLPLRAGGHPHMGLLVDGKHDSVGWRMHVETDDVLDLLSEGGVVGALEGSQLMRLQSERLPRWI